jgi:uncharacterized membrane protein required for colicin V production
MVNIVFDFLLLLAGVGGLLLGLRRGFLRTILSTVSLLLAMAFAAMAATPLVGVFVRGSGSQSDPPIAIVFAGLLLAFDAILEALFRRSFPVTRIRFLGSLDNVLGAIVAIPWTLLALALLVLVLGYGVYAVTGAPGAGLLGGWLTTSSLVAFLKEFFNIPVSLMRFLFPGGLPQPLAFFAGN